MATVVAQLGQYGNQFGPALFRRLFSEGLEDRGHISELLRYFRVLDGPRAGAGEGEAGPMTFVPRAVLVDTEPKAVEAALRTVKEKAVGPAAVMRYLRENAFTMQGGAGNNWAYGHNTLAPMLFDGAMDRLRRETERCDRLDSILVLSSLAGGTGSGVGSALAQCMRDEYRGCQLVVQTVLPMPNEVLTQDINAVLSLGALYSTAPLLIASNDELRNIYNHRLHASPSLKLAGAPSFDDINSTLAHQLTSSIRDSSLSSIIDSSINSYIRKCLLIRKCPPLATSGTILTTQGLLASVQRMVATGHYNDESYPKGDFKIYGGHVTLRKVDDPTSLEEFRTRFAGKLTTIEKFGRNMEAGIVLNSSSISNTFRQYKDSLLKKLSVNAYIHHYDKHGVSRDEIINSLRAVAQMESDYRV